MNMCVKSQVRGINEPCGFRVIPQMCGVPHANRGDARRIFSVSHQFLSAFLYTCSRPFVWIPHVFLGLSQKYELIPDLY